MDVSRAVPRWAIGSAVAAPVAMIGGWTLAASRQTGFDSVTDTISDLAATSATDPWIMTTGLAVTGIAHIVTAAGLREVPTPARVLHAIGGAATLAVAALPVDAQPRAHGIAASVGFGALALWPALAWRRGAKGVLRPAVGIGASAVLVVLLGAFVVELQRDGDAVGLTERVVAGAQALWPLAVATALARRRT
ncbi:DUF998 domain-containing protein [Cellulomonas rhizosphaerae]|uniref:DUF998 domain-containing protein n=1 Tax=Cellulomonas rhizosphaerae TaxID=2293719 RepID=A0A413RNR1_9CELL|nr:DUF998 domain-containing protein [Cellulomonas rhizosphaerae]RHA43540.1 DUF998 domain-containing protein [Cellulomonas rhizosphaerae]